MSNLLKPDAVPSLAQLLSDVFSLQQWHPPIGDWEALAQRDDLLNVKYAALFEFLGPLPKESTDVLELYASHKGFDIFNDRPS